MTPIPELERLARAATPGPWSSCSSGAFVTADNEAAGENYICSLVNCDGTRETQAFIAAANPAAVLRLLAAVKAASKLHGHADGCPVHWNEPDNCTCGFEQLEQALAELDRP